MYKIAQNTIPFSPSGGFRGFGRLGLENITSPTESTTIFTSVISTTIGVLTIVAFIWFTINLFISAIQLMSSGGDKAKVAEARGKMFVNLIGIVVVISALFISRLVADIFGLDILNLASTIIKIGKP